MARLLSFSYGAVTVGNGQSDASYNLTGKYRFVQNYRTVELAFEVVISNSSRAAFLASEAALLAEWRKPDQTLVVDLGGATRHTFTPADNTGFNIRSNCRKSATRLDTANSAMWVCSAIVELPADLSGRSALLTSSSDVAEDAAGIKTLTISGVYTATVAPATARAQFEASIDAKATAVIATIGGGTYERIGVLAATEDDQNKTLRFSQRYQELIYDQAVGSRDHATLADQSLVIRRTTGSAGADQSLGSVATWDEVSVEYSVSVVASVTTDLSGTWASLCRPHIIAAVEAISASGVVVVREEPVFDPVRNTISARVALLVDSGADFFQARRETRDRIDLGVILKPRWNGNPWARDRYDGPASHVRTVRWTLVMRGQNPPTHFSPRVPRGFVEVRWARRHRRFEIGIPGDEYPMQAYVASYTYVRADTEDAGGGSLGGGGDPTRTRVR